MNHSKKFIGDLLFRKALIRSLNVPAVKIMEKIGVPWAIDYAKRLGIVSPLNRDFTLALGSSSVTLYEITKAFAQLGRLGRQLNPIIIHKVVDQDGKVLLEKVSMNERFQEKYETLEKEFEERRLTYLDYMKNPEKYPNNYAERTNASVPVTDGEEAKKIRYNITKEPPLFFENPKQLMKPTTAYISTSLLKGVVSERGGTGGRARSLGRPVAGKTGSTNGYYDGWFVGYTPQIATGVWVGFDDERSLGTGEVGGRSALPIWLEYMKFAHEGLPTQDFQVPPGIVFANIDAETGKLASADSKEIVRQAFVEGTEPVELHGEKSADEEQDFYKEDLSE